MPTITELGQKTKAKYPEYQDMSDIEVGNKVKAKYPTEYADFTDVTETVSKPKKTALQKTSNVLDAVFGGQKIGEAIGTQIAKARATDEEKQYIDKGPTTSQIVGDVGRVALNFVPVGKISKGLGIAGKAIGLGKVAKPVANIATGAGIGYAGDVTTNLAEGSSAPLTPGVGTAIGTGLSSIPYVGKALAKGGQEILGATTGTGAGTIKQFSKAITEGGEGAKVAREALRGANAPQDIVDEARTALGTIIKNRSDDYSSQLSKLKTKSNVIDHTPIIEKFNKQLEDFGVFSNADGTPNFSRSPGLGRYEKDLQGLSETLKDWGTREGDNTITGVDKLKQVIDDFRIGSADSKKFDSFVTNLRSEAKNIIRKDLTKNKDLKTLLTYDKMLGDFEKSTKDIREIQKALSLGDKASTDTAFRKLSTVLRTNNEIRQKAVQEINEITGGTLIPKIAGQQLSELLPRGLARTVGTLGAGAGVVGGVGILPMLKLAATSSPRVVGELLNALGIVGNKANIVKNAILKTGIKTPGDYIFDSSSRVSTTANNINKTMNVKSVIPKTISKKGNMSNKGMTTVGTVLGGTGISAVGALGLARNKKEDSIIKKETVQELKPRQDGSKVFKLSTGTEVGEMHPKIRKTIEDAYKNYPQLPKGVLEAIIMKESSAGYDDSQKNTSIGKYAWLGGLTKIAKKELTRLGYKSDFDTIGGAINSIAKFYSLKSKNESPIDVYRKEYSSGRLSEADIKKFEDMYNYYSNL
jgi:hypothetical protein